MANKRIKIDVKEQRFTAQETAKLLRLSKSRVYELLETGELSCYRIGNRRVVAAHHIEQFLVNREAPKAS